MLAYRGPDDLYTVLSTHYPVESSKPMVIKQLEQQSISKKRSWDDVVSPSLQIGQQGTVLENNRCSQDKLHALLERKRRKKMSYMFNILSSLLPAGFNGKVDKISIIDETINYIKSLQGTLKDLQARKSELEELLIKSSLPKSDNSFQVYDVQVPESAPGVSTPNLKILSTSVVGTHAFASIWGSHQSGFLPKLLSSLDANQLEMMDYTINVDGCNTLYTLHVKSKSNSEQPILKAFRCVMNSIASGHQK